MIGNAGGLGFEDELRAAIARRVGAARFGLWFGDGVRLGVSGDSLEVGVPNEVVRDWMRGRFADNLAEAGSSVAGRPLRVTFRVHDEAETPSPAAAATPADAESTRTSPTSSVASANIPNPQILPTRPIARERERLRGQNRPPKRLDDFVVGPCNRFAHAAAKETVENLGAGYNPLVIHGGVGLGKSHLLEAVAHAIRGRHPGLNVIQTTAEAFTNGFLDAMRNGTLAAFRNRFRKADALIVDDVHFLAAKRATQDEFLHTFNSLVAEGAVVVLSCDQHPRLIHKLPDELITRFLGGMVVKLETPDLPTRRLILKAKAAARGVDLPEPVVNYVAEHLRSGVRELEGAMHAVVAHALLTGKRIDLALAKTALRDTIRHNARAVALRDVEHAICSLFQIDADLLKSDGRARAIAYPRMMAMFLARKHTGASYSEIGRYFGGRNHSTVISAEKKVLSWLREEQRHQLLAGFESAGDVLAALERMIGT